MKHILYAYLCLLFVGGIAQAVPISHVEAWQDFNAKRGGHLRVQWNAENETPEMIEGVFETQEEQKELGIAVPMNEDALIRLTLRLVDNDKDLFGVSSANLRLSRVRKVNTEKLGILYLVQYRQTLARVPIRNSRFFFLVNANGTVFSVDTTLFPDIERVANVEINADRARNLALGLGGPKGIVSTPELLVGPSEEGYRTILRIIVEDIEKHSASALFFDGNSGALIAQRQIGDEYRNTGTVEHTYFQDNTGYDNPLPEFSNTQLTYLRVYNTAGSLVASGSTYGTGVVAYDFSWSGATGYYYLVAEQDSSLANATSQAHWFTPSSNHSWNFGKANQNFLNNVYSRALTTRAFFQNHGHSQPKVFVSIDPLDSNTLGRTTSSTRFYVRPDISLVVDTTAHEFTHCVIYDIYGPGGVGGNYPWSNWEEDTMDEAFSYYFASRVSSDWAYNDPMWFRSINDPQIWGDPVHWNQHNENADAHWNAWILASTLWDFVTNNNQSIPSFQKTVWDDIIWLAILTEMHRHASFKDQMVAKASIFGQSYVDRVEAIFTQQHGIHGATTPAPALLSQGKSQSWAGLTLHANYPNPFNPETWIPFELAQDSDVQVAIYDLNGTLVRRLNLGTLQKGVYTAREKAAYWDGRNDQGEPVASGSYLYEVKAGTLTQRRRMLLLK